MQPLLLKAHGLVNPAVLVLTGGVLYDRDRIHGDGGSMVLSSCPVQS